MRYQKLARKLLLLSLSAYAVAPYAASAAESDDTSTMKHGGIELQQLSPQLDESNSDSHSTSVNGNASINTSPPQNGSSTSSPLNGGASTDTSPSTVNIHKLSVSKHARNDDSERGAADLTAPPQSNSFSLMNALFGSRGKELAKLYAERDTGYGVCGFAMSVPITLRGYVMVTKCFPSMPAAEAQIQAGDLILAVDGRSTRDIPAREIWDYFTGMPGTEVQLLMHRGRQAFNVTLKRMDIGRIPDFQTRATFLSLYQRNGVSKFVQR